jgi:tetratricopeptide (TPR) repeat protein
MRILSAVCPLLIAVSFVASAQSNPTRIAGVDEPPELTGQPKKLPTPSEVLLQFKTVMDKWKDNDTEAIKSLQPDLDRFVQQHPDYSDAHLLRAHADYCVLNSKDYSGILKDIDVAIKTHTLSGTMPSMYDKPTDHYSLRAKLYFSTGHTQQAMTDLDTAVNLDLKSAEKIFNIEGVEPQKTSKPCTWSMTDLDALVKSFPKDFRAYLYRGLYLSHFATFKEDFYSKANQEFQSAAATNPRSPLPHFFMGYLYALSSIATKAGWSSTKFQQDAHSKAIGEFTKAIALDSTLLPAYMERAASYYELSQSKQALKDYDTVLDFDHEYPSAYHYRALAKMDLGLYQSAIFDFGEAIRRNRSDNLEPNLYEGRADAYINLNEPKSALADLSKAIESSLPAQIFSMNISQFRALYPEYDGVSAETLARKLNVLFWPQYPYDVFAERFLKSENNGWGFLLKDLYVKRGDAYLGAKDFKRAVSDFNRVFKGIPGFADTLDRWRSLGSSSDGEHFYVDVKTMEFPNGGPARLWLKTASKDTQTVEAYEVDCKMKRINNTSAIEYDADGKVLRSSDAVGGWQSVRPDTLGEQLYNGMCLVKQ